MISFQVNDMTCGHCVSTITKALQGVDAKAKVQFDLATHRVDIEPDEAGASELRDAIQAAGYTPEPIEAASTPGAGSAAPARKGCCCG